MEDRRAQREQCRTLADRLIVEYAGAVPPGQVLAAVLRVHHALDRHLELSTTARLALCESSVRRLLAEHSAGRGTGHGHRGPTSSLDGPALAS